MHKAKGKKCTFYILPFTRHNVKIQSYKLSIIKTEAFLATLIFLIYAIDCASLFSGLYTLPQHLHDHEIVIPRKVNHRGDLISHNVTHHHHEDGPIVHYRVTVAGNEYHLELTASDNFIGRAMVVERRKRDLHVRSPAKSHGSKCHYRGFIKGHRNSPFVPRH